MSSSPSKRRKTREFLTYEKKKNLIREIENSSIDIVARKYGIKITTLYGFINLETKKRIFDACDKGWGMKKKLPKDKEDDKCDKPKKKKPENLLSVGENGKTHVGESEWSSIRNNYNETDIYLAVEMGLFFKTKIDECPQLRGEKCESGDMSDRRFTALICSDLTGKDARKLVVVGKFQKLSTNPPVNYYPDENAWMTAEIFKKELTEWDAKLQEQNRNIVLFTDEKLVHRRLDHLKRIKLMFYTDLHTRRNIIFDMVRCTKAIYRRNIMEYLAKTAEKNPNGKITPGKAVLLLFKAYKAVQPESLRSSFIEAGIIDGEPANVHLSVIDKWSQSVSPDYTLLKAYTEFDDQLVTSADGGGDDSEEGESEEESDRLVTVGEAFEAARTLGDYCAQGSLSEDLTAKVLDIVVEVEEQLRSFKSLLASGGNLGQTSQQPGLGTTGATPLQVTQVGQSMTKSTAARKNLAGSRPSGCGRSQGNPAKRKGERVPARAVKRKWSEKEQFPPANQSRGESGNFGQNTATTVGNNQVIIPSQQVQRRPSTEGNRFTAGNDQGASTSQQGPESAQVKQPRPSTSVEVQRYPATQDTIVSIEPTERRPSTELQPSSATQGVVVSTLQHTQRRVSVEVHPTPMQDSGNPSQQVQRRSSTEVQHSLARQDTVISTQQPQRRPTVEILTSPDQVILSQQSQRMSSNDAVISTQQPQRRPTVEMLTSPASRDQVILSQQSQRTSSNDERAQPAQPNLLSNVQRLPLNQSSMSGKLIATKDCIYKGPNGKVIFIDLHVGDPASPAQPGHPSVCPQRESPLNLSASQASSKTSDATSAPVDGAILLQDSAPPRSAPTVTSVIRMDPETRRKGAAVITNTTTTTIHYMD